MQELLAEQTRPWLSRQVRFPQYRIHTFSIIVRNDNKRQLSSGLCWLGELSHAGPVDTSGVRLGVAQKSAEVLTNSQTIRSRESSFFLTAESLRGASFHRRTGYRYPCHVSVFAVLGCEARSPLKLHLHTAPMC